MKIRITLSFLISIVVFIVAFAVLCPRVNICRIEPIGDASFEALFEDGKINCSQASISVEKSENFDYIITCDLSSKQIKSINVTFKNAASTYTQTQIEFAENTNFIDGNVTSFQRFKGDVHSCTGLSSDFFKINTNEQIERISFYESHPQETVKPLQIKASRYIAVVVFTIVAFAFAFFIDKRFNLFLKILLRIKKFKKEILFFIAGITTVAIISAFIEVLMRRIIGPDSLGKNFNTASFCAIAIILTVAFLFYFERKNLQQRPERLVAMLILSIGTLIILTEPFSHNSSDEDSHYYYALQNSFYKEAYFTAADYNASYTIDFEIAHSLGESAQNIVSFNENAQTAIYATPANPKLTHKFAGALIAVSRLFGASFWERFVIAQFAMLIVYAITVYFAIKKLKSGKMIASVLAMCPTNILLASNFSYDPWVVGFSLLGISYFLSEVQQPEKRITTLETIIMCGSFVLAALPKQIYCFFLILPMLMIKNWRCKKEKQRYYLLLAAFFAYIFISFATRSLNTLGGAGDWRGGNVDPSGQVAYILSNPIKYAQTLLKFLFEYFSFENANKSINFFSYLGESGSPIVLILILAFCTITDKNEYDGFNGSIKIRIITILISFVTICLIATALYIDFTPVANDTILGCHPRYQLPLLAPILLVLIPPYLAIKRHKSVYNGAVLATMTGFLLFKIFSIITVVML